MKSSENYNIGYLCSSQQCNNGLSNKLAMRLIKPDLSYNDYYFSELDLLSNKFANVIKKLNIEPGEIIFTFLPKTLEQFIVFLGSLKAKVIIGTLFSTFGE